MTVKNQSIISTRKRRKQANGSIHNIFVFKRSGICIYGKNITQTYNMEDNLISAFFTALRSFTLEMVGEKVKTVEMGNVKFVILRKINYYYGFLVNTYESISVLKNLAEKIHLKYQEYKKKHGIRDNVEHIQNKKFDKDIDRIIENIVSKEYDFKKEKNIVDKLRDFSQSGDIDGLVLLTEHGKVVFTSIDGIILNNLLKEMNFRMKIHNNSILKMYYTSKNEKIVFSEHIGDLYYIILVFNLSVKFGIAEYYLRKAVKIIRTSLDE